MSKRVANKVGAAADGGGTTQHMNHARHLITQKNIDHRCAKLRHLIARLERVQMCMRGFNYCS